MIFAKIMQYQKITVHVDSTVCHVVTHESTRTEEYARIKTKTHTFCGLSCTSMTSVHLVTSGKYILCFRIIWALLHIYFTFIIIKTAIICSSTSIFAYNNSCFMAQWHNELHNDLCHCFSHLNRCTISLKTSANLVKTHSDKIIILLYWWLNRLTVYQ